VTTLTACSPENEMDDPPSCAAGSVNTGAFESATAAVADGERLGAGTEPPFNAPAPPGASVCPSVGAPDDRDGDVGDGVGCGVLQSIRIGMQSAVCAASADAGGRAAPSPLSPTSRHSAAAIRDRFAFSVCVQ
jgi:hypothetical protein